MVRLPCDLQRCSPAARLDLGWSNRSDFLRSLFVAGPSLRDRWYGLYCVSQRKFFCGMAMATLFIIL